MAKLTKISAIISLPEEVWRDIAGYDGRYEISNKGRVLSHALYNGKNDYSLGRIMNQFDIVGYKCVMLTKNGTGKIAKVHRLVAKAFIPNPDNLPTVNHLDENKRNNDVSNLEWASVERNNNYGSRLERAMKTWHKFTSGHRPRRVQMVRTNGEKVCQFESASEAQRCTGISESHIIAVCRNNRNIAGGFLWKYVEGM